MHESKDQRVRNLWYFAQIERGVELSMLDREPLVGSEKVLEQIATTRNISTAAPIAVIFEAKYNLE